MKSYGKDITLTGAIDEVDFGFNAHHVMVHVRSTTTDVKGGFGRSQLATILKEAVATFDFNTTDNGARYFYLNGTVDDILSVWAW